MGKLHVRGLTLNLAIKTVLSNDGSGSLPEGRKE